MCNKYTALKEIADREDPNHEAAMVFLNFDCVIREILRQWNDISYHTENYKPKVVNDVVQFILEVIASYKHFFSDCSMIMYHTDYESKKFDTAMAHGENYRRAYLDQINSIKYRAFKEFYLERLYDVINMVIDSIPNVYLIKVTNMDGNMVPYSFAMEYPERRMFVVSWDNVDVLLEHDLHNISVIYDARGVNCISPIVDIGKRYIDRITNAINPNHYGRFATRVLLAAVGNEIRSLPGIGKRPTGYDTVAQWLQRAFGNSRIPYEFTDYHSISRHVPETMREGFEESFLGMDLEYQYQMMKDRKADILYKMDHEPVPPKEIIRCFPNIVFDWDKLYL